MRTLTSIVSLALLVLSACGDNQKQTPDDAAVTPDVAIDAPPQVTGGPCLLQPTDVATPPTGALPCDMLPPDFVAETP